MTGRVLGSVRRPLQVWMDATRSASELAASVLASPLLAAEPRGDGHSVLVLPGWLAGDASTLPLRRWLAFLGYDVHGWRQGTNRGPTIGNVAALQRTVRDLADRSGQPVSIIGWSLGGQYAYQLARGNPASVRQVITLGTPARMRWTGSRVTSRLADSPARTRFLPPFTPRSWDQPGPLRVPVTAIHAKSDPIAAWRSCLVPAGPRRQNLGVRSSHLGFGHNPAVLHVIAHRLGTDPRRWTPYEPSRAMRAVVSVHHGRG